MWYLKYKENPNYQNELSIGKRILNEKTIT